MSARSVTASSRQATGPRRRPSVTTAAAPPSCRSRSQNGSAPVGLDEPHRPLDRADLDDVADLDPAVLAPVDRHERLVRVDDPGPDDLARRRRRSSGSWTGSRRSASRRGCGCAGRGSGRRPRTSSRSTRWGSTTTRPSATNVARCDSSMRHVEPDDAGQRAARHDDVVERGERPVRRRGRPGGCGRSSAIRSRTVYAPACSFSSTRLELVRLRHRRGSRPCRG